jgi:hypothetical protein
MRKSVVPGAVRDVRIARSAHGRRALAAARVLAALSLAALSLAALAGCTAAATPKPAAAAASQPTAQVALQFGRNVLPPAGPPPAAIDAFRWSALAGSPLGYRNSPLLAWADGRLLEFGGWPPGSTGRSAAGAAFDPATGRWKRIADAPPGGSFAAGDSSAVWTGRSLAVASGDGEPCPGNPAPAPHCWTGLALYNPAANRWTVLAVPRQFDGLALGAVVWTGHDLIIGAVSPMPETDPDAGRLAVAAYSPTTGRWQVITPARPRGHSPGELNLVYDDGRLLLWSLWQDAVTSGQGQQGSWGIDVLALNARGAWQNVTGSWPQSVAYGLTATSGGIMVAPGGYWCGDLCTGFGTSGADAYFANPATLALKRIPAGPLSELSPGSFDFVWAGDAIIAVSTVFGRDGSSAHPILSGDLAMFDPATGRWTTLSATPGHPELAATPVWTGAELLTLTTAGALLAFHR